MTEKRAETLRTLRDTLHFHQEMGIREYPGSVDIRRFLEAKSAPVLQQPENNTTFPTDDLLSAGIKNLKDEINACSQCQLSGNPLGRVPGTGKTGCRLMIVGDYSSQEGSFSSEVIFGQEEDVMLWKMMTAINLAPDTVYVTNVLKCCPSNAGIIDEQCETKCFSFLAREIAAIKPLIICAMGEMAARVITGRKDPLARLRGRFGSYRYESGKAISVMPTFHPRFLLQHQEMKKATWNDLLAIRRRLDETT